MTTGKNFKLKTTDKRTIYCTLNQSPAGAKDVIILVHGLAGARNEHTFFNAARYFPAHKFATIRFALYSFEADARKLDECSFSDHVEDLNRVVRYARKRFKNLYLVGHSLGGPTVVFSDTHGVKGVVLWDPTFNPARTVRRNSSHDKKIDSFVINWRVKIIWGKRAPEELLKIPDCASAVARLEAPLKVIAAGKGGLLEDAHGYIAAHKGPKSLSIVRNATHCFDEKGAEEELFAETLRWIAKFKNK